MRNDQSELMELNSRSALFEILIRRLYSLRCGLGDICVDAGANQGHHTIPMAYAVGPTGGVHAFEPIPRFAHRLRRIASERYLPIRIYEIALSDRIGRSQFQYVKTVPGWSGLYEHKYKGDVDVEVIDVEASTL